MRISLFFCYIITFISLFFLGSCSSDVPTEISTAYQDLPDKIDFNFHVRPILSDRCYACHGPDENAREAKFRLDIEKGAFAALSNSDGFAIIAGNTHDSKIIRRILSEDAEFMMPPPASEMQLTETEKAIIYKWIAQGATWKKHWAFIPPLKPELPKVSNQNWCKNEIDYFIQNKQKEQGLKQANAAKKEQWLRRVTFDITGLPPKLMAINAFLQDDSPEAFEKVVDALLASPAYGERMTSVWLDIARYADSHGYQDDRPRTMWPWRDWVIKAFNENLPYDKFATWQIAGDLLPNATYEQKLATGFNRNHAITQEGGVVQEEYLTEYAADRTQTFSTTFMGLTMQCARCHSHKYDPIEQAEYYSMLGFFNNIQKERGQISYFDLAPKPNLPMVDPLMDSTIVQIQQLISRKETHLANLKNEKYKDFEAWLSNDFKKENLELALKEGLIANFSLNNLENGQFESAIPNQPSGLMNINLPPAIPLPTYLNGKKDKALKFDGANFLSLGEIGDFEWNDAFSFGGWIKHSNQHRKNAGIFARRVGEQKRQGYELVLTPNNQLAAHIIHQYNPARKNRKGINYAIDVQTKTRIPTNQWKHVAVTYDGSGKAAGLHIYINGEQQRLQVIMDSLRNKTMLTGNDFLVGNWNNRARETRDLYGFKGGTVDNAFVYNRELSPVELKYLVASNKQATKADLYTHYLLNKNRDYQIIRRTLDSLRKIDLEKPNIMIMQEADTVKATFVLDRGAYDAKANQVERGTPKSVLAFSPEFPQNRLGLAQWLFADKNPLTSRVVVNRFWQLFFGRGLVATPEDFGNQGALPSHPELLDWLAVYFKETGWDMKQLVKLMVLSATYRQDATITPKSLQKDPSNKWLARGPVQKLTAEMLRDQALVAGDLYYEKVGGKWVKPYQPPGIWKELANQIGENKYRPSTGKDLYRRSLYGYWKRTIPPPTMLTFDAAERAECTVKRQQTSTPLQSLALLNDPLYMEAARKIGESLLVQQVGENELINHAFYTIVSRQPTAKESQLLKELFQAEIERFLKASAEANQVLAIGATPYNQSLDKTTLAGLTVVINAIFNLDEAKYK